MTGEPRAWVIAIAVAAGVWLVGWAVTRLFLVWIVAWAKRTNTHFDDALTKAIRPHLPVWFLALGVAAGARKAPITPGAVHLADQLVIAAIAISAASAASSFVIRALAGWTAEGGAVTPVNTLIRNIVRVLFLGIAAVVVLSNMGISVTPLVTALGVGSLAVALALQPTLSNLFAGMHLLVARHVRIGDMIELENGQQGVVVDIGWRSTLLREMPDNTFIVPNARLVEMIVKSYGLPDAEHNLIVPVAVGYDTDLEHALRVTTEVAQETQRASSTTSHFQPVVTVRALGASSIDLAVVLRVPHFSDRAQTLHELLRRLRLRYREEGIEFPYPQIVVHRPPGESTTPAGESPPREGGPS